MAVCSILKDLSEPHAHFRGWCGTAAGLLDHHPEQQECDPAAMEGWRACLGARLLPLAEALLSVTGFCRRPSPQSFRDAPLFQRALTASRALGSLSFGARTSHCHWTTSSQASPRKSQALQVAKDCRKMPPSGESESGGPASRRIKCCETL